MRPARYEPNSVIAPVRLMKPATTAMRAMLPCATLVTIWLVLRMALMLTIVSAVCST